MPEFSFRDTVSSNAPIIDRSRLNTTSVYFHFRHSGKHPSAPCHQFANIVTPNLQPPQSPNSGSLVSSLDSSLLTSHSVSEFAYFSVHLRASGRFGASTSSRSPINRVKCSRNIAHRPICLLKNNVFPISARLPFVAKKGSPPENVSQDATCTSPHVDMSLQIRAHIHRLFQSLRYTLSLASLLIVLKSLRIRGDLRATYFGASNFPHIASSLEAFKRMRAFPSPPAYAIITTPC